MLRRMSHSECDRVNTACLTTWSRACSLIVLLLGPGCSRQDQRSQNRSIEAQAQMEASLRATSRRDTVRIAVGRGDSTIHPGDWLIGGVPYSGPQPRRSPDLRVSHAEGWRDYDVAPEVITRVPARPVLPLPRSDKLLQAKMPQFLYLPDGRVRGAFVEATVDERGFVRDAHMSGFLGDSLTHALEGAARAWRFLPAGSKGKPVPVVVSFPVLIGRLAGD